MNRKTVLITGSSRGLGRELALVFSRECYNIIINGRNEDGLKKTEKEVSKNGVNCYSVLGDLRDEETISRLYNYAKDSDLSVLINNAGISTHLTSFNDISIKDLEEVLDINLIAPIRLTKRIYPLFLEKGSGCVININSILGLEPRNLKVDYCSAKWGLRGFTASLRLEAKKDNIRIIGVYPTRIKTKPEFEYGMDPYKVAMEIHNAYKNGSPDFLVLDKRPKEFKLKRTEEYG